MVTERELYNAAIRMEAVPRPVATPLTLITAEMFGATQISPVGLFDNPKGLAQLAKYGQFRPRYEQLRERGDDMWWYICIGPQPPYANWLIYQQGSVNRTVLWQQYFYDIDGILYWSTTAWDMGEHDHRSINLKRINNGDGLLIYNGGMWDEGPVPVPSIRLEQVRDGIEDFQYLRQLERELGRDAALEYTTRVTTDILVYSDDYHDIESAREEMGFVLEALASAND